MVEERYTELGTTSGPAYVVLEGVSVLNYPTVPEIEDYVREVLGKGERVLKYRDWRGYTRSGLNYLLERGYIVEELTTPVSYSVTESGEHLLLVLKRGFYGKVVPGYLEDRGNY